MKITLTELLEIIANNAQRLALIQQVSDLLAERASLKQQILDLLAGDAATHAKASAVFEKSETVEAKMRAGLPTQ